ncbi:hypothetical protein HY025_03510 [Candidatus Daviesbacteria bacterium]|nr:hypothetical protein [Candidatus Daviesbacteria bacterium]
MGEGMGIETSEAKTIISPNYIKAVELIGQAAAKSPNPKLKSSILPTPEEALTALSDPTKKAGFILGTLPKVSYWDQLYAAGLSTNRPAPLGGTADEFTKLGIPPFEVSDIHGELIRGWQGIVAGLTNKDLESIAQKIRNAVLAYDFLLHVINSGDRMGNLEFMDSSGLIGDFFNVEERIREEDFPVKVSYDPQTQVLAVKEIIGDQDKSLKK